MPIKRYKTVPVSTSFKPYTYLFTSDLPGVSFTNPSGTSDANEVSTYVVYENEALLSTATITLSITNSNGCPATSALTIDGNCDSLTLNNISYSDPYTFSVISSHTECTSVDFEWFYDDSLFNLDSEADTPFSSVLKLKVNPAIRVFPNSTTVRVRATDCNGCQKEKVNMVDLCIPTAQDVSAKLYCTSTSTFASGTITLPDLPDCSSPTDWDTLEVELPTGFSHSVISDGKIKVTAVSGTTAGNYVGTYTVRNEAGVIATTGNLVLVVIGCPESPSIVLTEQTFEIPLGTTPSTLIPIPIENNVILVDSTRKVDWSTWTTVDPPTPLGGVVLNTDVNGDHQIDYTTPTPVGDDQVGWTVADDLGRFARAVTYPIHFASDLIAPVSDSTCAVVGTTINIDVLSNDVAANSEIDISTVQVSSAPSAGTATPKADGTIDYTPDGTVLGNDTFDYIFQNVRGQVAPDTTVTVDVISAGTSATIDVCGDSTITPKDFLGTPLTTLGTWTNTTIISPTPAAPGAWDGTITFVAATHKPGLHTYDYQVTSGSCSDTKTLSINYSTYDTVANDTCATASVQTAMSFDNVRVVANRTNAQTCPGPDAPTDSGVAKPTEWGAGPFQGDLWYQITATSYSSEYAVNFRVDGSPYGADGIFAPGIAVYTGTCGAPVLESASIASSADQVVYGVAVNPVSTSTTYYVRIVSLDTTPGRFDLVITT